MRKIYRPSSEDDGRWLTCTRSNVRFVNSIGLLIQPDLIQGLVQVVTGCNFPPFHIRAMGIDLVPPQCQGGPGGIKYFIFELSHD